MKKNGSILLGVLLVLVGLMTVAIGLSSAVMSSSVKIQKQYKQLDALTYAEAGVNKGLWKVNQNTDNTWLNNAKSAQGTLETDLSGGQYRVWILNCNPVSANCYYIKSTGFLPTEAKPQATRTVRVKINGVQNVTTLNFGFSAQSGTNQISMSSNATIKGSAYSNGPIYMTSNATITGNAISTGTTPTTSYISGSSNAKIMGDAHAYTISGNSSFVKGTKYTGVYPPSQDPPIAPANLQSTIDTWEASASGGGVYNGNKTITGNNNSLGPIKINGNLVVSNNAKLKLTGAVWVDGNITISNNSTVYLDPSYGNNSEVFIADYKQDRTNSSEGVITISNNATISGVDANNPKTPSYILVFSTQQPSTPSNWQTQPAITLSSNVLGGVYYAPFGSYSQSGNAQIRAVVANGIVLSSNAMLDYDGNWGNSGISTGPGGKWTITEWLILD
jgi:cytoskeletal protein CcmA (bactofilin family)